jgi:hypothetical protein
MTRWVAHSAGGDTAAAQLFDAATVGAGVTWTLVQGIGDEAQPSPGSDDDERV